MECQVVGGDQEGSWIHLTTMDRLPSSFARSGCGAEVVAPATSKRTPVISTIGNQGIELDDEGSSCSPRCHVHAYPHQRSRSGPEGCPLSFPPQRYVSLVLNIPPRADNFLIVIRVTSRLVRRRAENFRFTRRTRSIMDQSRHKIMRSHIRSQLQCFLLFCFQ